MTETAPESARLTADAADRDAETGLPFDSGVDTAVERWFRTHFHAAQALGFPMAGYEAERDTRRRLQDRLANRVITAETGRHDAADLARENAELRKLLADAPTSEAAIAKLREWSSHSGPDREWQSGAIQIAMPVAIARKILDEIDRLEAELAETRADRETFRATLEQDAKRRIGRQPLTPGVPGYACARCGSLFTSPGEPRDEHSRHADSPWCRNCVDLCHEAGDGHRCVICTPDGAR